MNNSVLAQLAALPGETIAELKQMWRDLYDREAPSFNREFLVKRSLTVFRSWPTAGCRRGRKPSCGT